MKILPTQFDGQAIRRVYDEATETWWFSVIDIVQVLTGSTNANRYWSDLKRKLAQEAGSEQPYEKIVRLKLMAPDGKQRLTDCATAQSLLRIVQSIPSPKAEPFKRWLAKVGKERLDEIENPELAMGRMQDLYEKKGYPKEWIDKRLRGIAVRQETTGSVKAMMQLMPLKIDKVGAASVLSGNERYEMADNVQVYLWYKGQYYPTKLAQVDADGYQLTGWYDNFGCAAGKKVRVIIAVKND